MEDGVITEKSKNKLIKKKKKGIVYLSNIPPFMNVTIARGIFNQYGQVGRIYFQPAQKGPKKKKTGQLFTEGWVEFERKKIAKQIAISLNNQRIDEKKKSKFYDYLWNIKYLPRFKWIHISERLAYERAVQKHKMRAEIGQAKREANYLSHNLDKSSKLKKKKLKRSQEESMNIQIKQKDFKISIEDNVDRSSFLQNVMS